jgi:hypothetical protein
MLTILQLFDTVENHIIFMRRRLWFRHKGKIDAAPTICSYTILSNIQYTQAPRTKYNQLTNCVQIRNMYHFFDCWLTFICYFINCKSHVHYIKTVLSQVNVSLFYCNM